jgi:hypothetical protein
MTTPEQLKEMHRRAIDDFVAAKCANLPCGVCEKSIWQGGEIYGLPGVSIRSGYAGGDVERSSSTGHKADDVVVTVRCKGCGRILLFSAKSIGIDVGR